MRSLSKKATENPAAWVWAKSFFEEYDTQETALEQATHDIKQFIDEYHAAVIAPDELRKFKKENKDYNEKLREFLVRAAPYITSLASLPARIHQMHEAAESPTPQKSSKPSAKRARTGAPPKP